MADKFLTNQIPTGLKGKAVNPQYIQSHGNNNKIHSLILENPKPRTDIKKFKSKSTRQNKYKFPCTIQNLSTIQIRAYRGRVKLIVKQIKNIQNFKIKYLSYIII